jgi:hypothetical protein
MIIGAYGRSGGGAHETSTAVSIAPAAAEDGDRSRLELGATAPRPLVAGVTMNALSGPENWCARWGQRPEEELQEPTCGRNGFVACQDEVPVM